MTTGALTVGSHAKPAAACGNSAQRADATQIAEDRIAVTTTKANRAVRAVGRKTSKAQNVGPQAISPECFHKVHEACACSNSCGCLCHIYEVIDDDEANEQERFDEWLDMIEDEEFSQNGYC